MKKKCSTCWGKKKVCIALRKDLSPILEDCRDCEGRGYIELEVFDDQEQSNNA